MDKKQIERNIQTKILITYAITFLLIFFLFYNVYGLANDINNEISYKNYIANFTKIKLNPDGTLSNNITLKIKHFPLLTKIIIGLTLLLLLQQTSWLVDLYKKDKQQKSIEKNLNTSYVI